MSVRGDPVIDRPVFLIGCGRSGTTLLYDVLCGHPDLAWFSNWSDRFPRVPAVAAIGRGYPRGPMAPHRRGRPHPSEGYRLWDRIRPPLGRAADRPLTEADVTHVDRARARAIIGSHLRWMGRTRFVNKNTRNIRRIRYLDELFPDARFVHITRDPRAATASLLRVAFWPTLPIWFEGGVTPQEWVAGGGSELELAAQVWAREMAVAAADQAMLPDERLMIVRYEDLVAEPRRCIAEVLHFTGLRADVGFDDFVAAFPIRDENAKLATRLTEAEIQVIDAAVAPVAETFGYAVG